MTKSYCKGENGYVAKIEKLDNTKKKEVQCNCQDPNVHKVDMNNKTGVIYACYKYVDANKSTCDEPMCREELSKMFGIVGGQDADLGMAKQLGMCWSYKKWRYKNWEEGYESNTKNCPDSNKLDETVEWPSPDLEKPEWPNYAHFGI